jgi:hypothetical protein
MRVVPALFIAISVSLCAPAWATTHLDASTSKELSRLEQQYFKQTFGKDSDDTRIQRLEKLVFGQTVTGETSERVKNLVSAADSAASADPTLAPAVTSSAPSAPASAPARRSIKAPGSTKPTVAAADGQQHLPNADFSMRVTEPDSEPTPNQTKYPRITTLENDILGQAYEADSLSARLTRMEKKAFGGPSSEKDLSDRTDALEAYASKKLHKKTLEQQEQSENTASNPQQQSGGFGQKLFNMVGKSLLGMGGAGVGPGGGGMAMGPGMGMGMGPGFGGMGMRHRGMQQQQQQQQPPQQPAPKPEDPAIFATDPPPPNSRMSTQVGWCEVQVFGKTFPEKHLPDRLGQLNRELQYKPGRSDMELMDDMNGLVKAVGLRSNRAIGASPTSGIH